MAKSRKKPSQPTITNNVEASRCIKCQSTERSGYTAVRKYEIAGIDTDTGKEYNQVVTKRTKCLGCGQSRLDRFKEKVSVKAPKKKKEGSPRDRREKRRSMRSNQRDKALGKH